ncbi:MAG: LysR substrate-binding domain-containing protein [Polyangiaceae bacterium]
MKLGALPLSLRQLQYVVAVAEELSFSKAAVRCSVSQPSLSGQIAELEDALGARLFERDHRKVLLTALGEQVVARARAVLREVDAIVELAQRAKDPLSGTLRIGVIPTVSPYFVPEVRPALRAAFPALRVLWVEEKTPTLVAKLAAGEIDAALLALEAEIGEVEHEVVGFDPFVVAAPRTHRLMAESCPAKRSDLASEDVLLLEDGHCLRDQALTVCTSARAEELEFRATSLPTLAQMVADGAGITLLPRLAVATEAERAGLATRDFAAPSPGRTLALVWRKRSPLGAPLRELASVVRGAAKCLESRGKRRSAEGR